MNNEVEKPNLRWKLIKHTAFRLNNHKQWQYNHSTGPGIKCTKLEKALRKSAMLQLHVCLLCRWDFLHRSISCWQRQITGKPWRDTIVSLIVMAGTKPTTNTVDKHHCGPSDKWHEHHSNERHYGIWCLHLTFKHLACIQRQKRNKNNALMLGRCKAEGNQCIFQKRLRWGSLRQLANTMLGCWYGVAMQFLRLAWVHLTFYSQIL